MIDDRSSKYWLEAIGDAEKAFSEYQAKCDNIDKMYAELKRLSGDGREREMQIFWANIEVVKPSIYSRPPVPVVVPKFRDRAPLKRHASEVLERCLSSSFDKDDLHSALTLVRDDLALSGRGVIWCRYAADGNVERIAYDHIDRADFLHEPCRKWSEVGWVARRTFNTREEMRERFEEASGLAYLKAQYAKRKEDDARGYQGEDKAQVWEIWSKTKRCVVWVSEGVEDVLDITEPYLQLEEFFPCPRPAYGTIERRSLKPVPDFVYYKDQVEEVNELTGRISALSEALRMKGFYAGGADDLSSAIETAMKQRDNSAILVPVPNVAAMGGSSLKDAIIWLPVAEIAQTITSLIALRRQLIEDIYQITGISDIMRGETDADETLGAQQLKSQYGSVRIRERQTELVRLARDVARISAEIMAEHFTPESLMLLSQYDVLPTDQAVMAEVQAIEQKLMDAASDPQMVQMAQANPEQAEQIKQEAAAKIDELRRQQTFDKVVRLFRDQRTRPFVLDIETDSTIQPDENAAKQRVTEFLGALSGALQQLSAMVGAQPETAPFAAEVLKFAVGPFRAGRALDSAIDEFTDKVKQTAAQPRPNPEAERIKAEMQLKQAEIQTKAQTDQQAGQIEMAKAAAGIRKIEAEIMKINAEIAAMRAPDVMA